MKNTKNSANRRVLGQLLHGSWRYFIACIAASLLFTAFELVIPQIIRVSVDSLIGSGPVKVAAARPVVQALGDIGVLIGHQHDFLVFQQLVVQFSALGAGGN